MVVCKLKDISRLLIRIEVIKIDVALCHGITSLRPPKFTLCVREMCLRFGEKPFRTTRIVAWLSSCTLIFTVRLSSTSHKANAGIPSVKTECARLVTSDSLVGREVEVCLLLSHAQGKCDFGPFSTRYPPEVLRAPSFSPAKSASAKGSGIGWKAHRWCNLYEGNVWSRLYIQLT